VRLFFWRKSKPEPEPTAIGPAAAVRLSRERAERDKAARYVAEVSHLNWLLSNYMVGESYRTDVHVNFIGEIRRIYTGEGWRLQEVSRDGSYAKVDFYPPAGLVVDDKTSL